jgi:hypothetical protein
MLYTRQLAGSHWVEEVHLAYEPRKEAIIASYRHSNAAFWMYHCARQHLNPNNRGRHNAGSEKLCDGICDHMRDVSWRGCNRLLSRRSVSKMRNATPFLGGKKRTGAFIDESEAAS